MEEVNLKMASSETTDNQTAASNAQMAMNMVSERQLFR